MTNDYKKEYELALNKIVKLEEKIKKLKDNLDKREYYDKVNWLDKFVEMSNEMAELEKENKKLKEIMRDALYRYTKRNIKNVIYKKEAIEIWNWGFDYNLDDYILS